MGTTSSPGGFLTIVAGYFEAHNKMKFASPGLLTLTNPKKLRHRLVAFTYM
jgi:hypothetical protein